MTMHTQSGAHIRWMLRRDLPEVLAIEELSFEFPWDEEAFYRVLRQRNCIGMVAERSDRVVGFMVYELYRERLHLLSFAVHPNFRQERIGTRMVEKLISKLHPQRRGRMLLEIRETNVTAQLFFKNRGFRCIAVLRDFYDDTAEDAYVFEYRVSQGDARIVG